MDNYTYAVISETPLGYIPAHGIYGYGLAAGFALWLLFNLFTLRSKSGDNEGNVDKTILRRLPAARHSFAFLGYLYMPFKMLLHPTRYVMDQSIFWGNQSFRLKAFFTEIYIVKGRRDEQAIFRNGSLSVFFLHRTLLEYVFEGPKEAIKIYRADTSGGKLEPRSGSEIAHHNRAELHLRHRRRTFLLGPDQDMVLKRLFISTERRARMIVQDYKNKQDSGWTYIDDLTDTFKNNLSAVTIDSLAGFALMERYPHLVADILTIKESFRSFFIGLPSFLNFKAHRARQRALDCLMEWTEWARVNVMNDSANTQKDDLLWGGGFIRGQQELLSKMSGLTARTIASEDLVFLWSALLNASGGALWLMIEAFRDPELLQEIREEVDACIQASPDELRFDVDKLMKRPLLQAMFAENLRLRVHGFLVSCNGTEDVKVNDWVLPRNKLCAISSTTASMNPDFWESDEVNGVGHSVHEFYPGRFLKRDPNTNGLMFEMEGKQGHWIPFGAAGRHCPGRLFAKRLNIVTLAIMVTMYDCEFLDKDSIAINLDGTPLGVAPPKYKIPARLRLREARPIVTLSKDE